MKKKWQQLDENKRERLRDLAFLSPSLIGVAVFFIVPFFVIVYYSMVNNPIQHQFVFLDNFIALFKNSAFRTASKNTLFFSLIAVPLAVVLPFLLAEMLEARIPMKSQFRTFFLSPMMVPVASVVLIWQVIFANNGAMNDFLALFGVERIDWLKSSKHFSAKRSGRPKKPKKRQSRFSAVCRSRKNPPQRGPRRAPRRCCPNSSAWTSSASFRRSSTRKTPRT